MGRKEEVTEGERKKKGHQVSHRNRETGDFKNFKNSASKLLCHVAKETEYF